MKNYKNKKAPGFGVWLLKQTIPFQAGFTALGDYEEIYNRIAKRDNLLKAHIWYWKQIFKTIPLFIIGSIKWRMEMIKNYIKTAFRNLKRHTSFSIINITGLALGMACCILILLWVTDELSYDTFHKNANDLYRVVREIQGPQKVSRNTRTPVPLAITLKQEYPEIINTTLFSQSFKLLKKGCAGKRRTDGIPRQINARL